MKRYDPERILDNLRALDDFPEPSPPQGKHAAPPEKELAPEDPKTPSVKTSAQTVFPVFPADFFYGRIFSAIEESVDIAAVPPGARFRFLKVLIQRFLRIISGKQVNFNRGAAEALQILAEHTVRAGETHTGVLQEVERKMGDAEQKMEALDARIVEHRRFQEQILQLSAKLSAEGEARMRRMLHLFLEELRVLSSAANASPGLAPRAAIGPAVPSPSRVASISEDYSYLLYEDAFRGSKEQILANQEDYAAWIKARLEELPPATRRVLDVGCGRGQFLSLLSERGIEGVGVELNEISTKIGVEDGLNVVLADALEFLDGAPDASFGAVVAFQVVEHFPHETLRRFVELVHAKIAPGGVIAFETPNPGTFAAYRWYLMDPTHKTFLPPETLRFVCECAGFEHLETRMLHPVPDYLRLEPTGDEAQRENARRLNEVLFGPQDYCILARKPQ